MQKELAEKLEQMLEPHNAGEQELKDWLRGYGYKVKDLSDNPAYWKKDIDLLVNDKYTIEVKWDSLLSTTGNLFIETCADIDKGKQGWYEFCEADYLAYGAADMYIFLMFDYKKLKQHIEAHKEEYIKKTAADFGKDGIKKYSEGYLVPVDSLSGLYETIDIG
jgi:hypothetical protein